MLICEDARETADSDIKNYLKRYPGRVVTREDILNIPHPGVSLYFRRIYESTLNRFMESCVKNKISIDGGRIEYRGNGIILVPRGKETVQAATKQMLKTIVLKGCSHCGGDLFYDDDRYGLRQLCFQCNRGSDIPVLLEK